jgi:tryptophan 2,3-dioxygenase
MQVDDRIQYGNQRYNKFLDDDDSKKVLDSEEEFSLFTMLEKWLERTPFLQMNEFNFWASYQSAVEEMIQGDIKQIKENTHFDEVTQARSLKQYETIQLTYDALFDENKYIQLQKEGHRRLSQKATLGALFIQLYRDEPILQLPHRLLTQLINLDQLFMSWRNRHRLLVFRMIGVKIGTGGSTGHAYLKKTAEKHSVFRDFANLSTYIIPRSSLPVLPKELKKELGFYFTYEK